MGVHSGAHGFLLVFVKGIGGHGNNRDPGFGTWHFTDCLGSFISIFIWHLDIHQDQIIMIRRVCFQHIDADLSVLCPFHLEAMFLQNRDGNLCIQIIVFCQKDTSAFEICFFSLCRLMMQRCDLFFCGNKEWQFNGSPGSFRFQCLRSQCGQKHSLFFA